MQWIEREVANEQVFDQNTVTRPADQVGDRRAATSHQPVSGSPLRAVQIGQHIVGYIEVAEDVLHVI